MTSSMPSRLGLKGLVSHSVWISSCTWDKQPCAPCGIQTGHRLLSAFAGSALNGARTESPERAGEGFSNESTSSDVQAIARRERARGLINKAVKIIIDLERLFHYTDRADARLRNKVRDAHTSLQVALALDSSSPEALLALSRLHLYCVGPGLSPDVGVAVMKRAADLGLAEAQYQYGCLLRDEAEARNRNHLAQGQAYLRLAAEQGHPEALFLRGVAFVVGEVEGRDWAKAERCFWEASQQGHVASSTMYGIIIARGILSNEAPVEANTRRLSGHREGAQLQSPGGASTPATLMASAQAHRGAVAEEDADEFPRRVAFAHLEASAECGDELAALWLREVGRTT
eukprot:TRINITY_DN17806_c0_g2_i1.p1 TRINITY_DN17806_c0_g2~~TRINITY_DN17806_c0_g2_i1.p1  ORF type:complete len:344 (+),score=53.54 TRINITY_DN17806_c0_g2_i1:163-1194(+)